MPFRIILVISLTARNESLVDSKISLYEAHLITRRQITVHSAKFYSDISYTVSGLVLFAVYRLPAVNQEPLVDTVANFINKTALWAAAQ